MNYINAPEAKDLIQQALAEDIGERDITSELFIPRNKVISSVILCKENCVACGLGVAATAFNLKDKKIKFKPLARDGETVKKGEILAIVTGNARSILAAERVALNFLSLLSGIATKTRQFVKTVKPYKAKILDTRKTIPALRLLQKYAVRTGGGYNHRLSLDEMVMVKDNHLRVIGGVTALTGLQKRYKTELEVTDLKEFKAAIKLKPDIIMLDNMGIKEIKKAVQIRNALSSKTHPRPKLEASGGITLKNIRKVASTGVEMISIGALTQTVAAADISLEIL